MVYPADGVSTILPNKVTTIFCCTRRTVPRPTGYRRSRDWHRLRRPWTWGPARFGCNLPTMQRARFTTTPDDVPAR
ncbi:hypothetical protein GCM10027088_48650 [Nocardia goodfellowii]